MLSACPHPGNPEYCGDAAASPRRTLDPVGPADPAVRDEQHRGAGAPADVHLRERPREVALYRRYIRSTLIPGEARCMCLFEAPNRGPLLAFVAIRNVYKYTGIPKRGGRKPRAADASTWATSSRAALVFPLAAPPRSRVVDAPA